MPVLPPERKLLRAKLSMLFDHPFFGHLAMGLEPVEVKGDPEMETMGTDGVHLFYNPDFVEKMPEAQLCGVVAHELLHIILGHLPRRLNREPERWNYAADYAVNYNIAEEFQLPPGHLRSAEYDNKTAEYIYTKLPKEKSGKGHLIDSHSPWKDWGKGQGQGGQGQGQGGQDPNGQTGDLEQQWRERVNQAANIARIKGKLPAGMQSLVGELLQPKLPWKLLLPDMVSSCAKEDYRFIPPNKKHLWREVAPNTPMLLPSMTGTSIQIAFAVDSSGSMSDQDIREGLTELMGICETFDDYTVYGFIGDAKIQQRFELRPGDPLPKMVQGRGGTDFRPILKEAERVDISCLVYFTDGMGTYPDKPPPFPVIWLLTEGHQKPPFGHSVEMKTEPGSRRR